MVQFSARAKKFFLILLILSLASSIYLYVIVKPPSSVAPPGPTPSSPKIISKDPQMSALQTPQINLDPNVTFPSRLPPTLPVFQTLPPKSPNLSDIVSQFAAFFKLTPTTYSPNYWSSSDNSINLFIEPQSGSITYYLDSSVNPSAYFGNSNPTTAAAVSSAQNFIKKFTFFSNYSLQSDQITYFFLHPGEQDYGQVVNDPAQANLISVPFTETFNNYPYRSDINTTAPLIILLGQNNQVVKFIYTPQSLPTTSSSKDYYTLTLSEITAAIHSGQSSVAYAPLYSIPPQAKDLPPVTITGVQIEYHYNPNTSALSPFFLLYGHFSPPNSKSPVTYPIILLLPAVKITSN